LEKFDSYVRNGKEQIRKLLNKGKGKTKNLEDVLDESIITNTIRNALATGNWGKSLSGEVIKTGVS